MLSEMFSSGRGPDSVIDEKGLKPIEDNDTLVKAIEETIKENPEAAARIKAGETKPVDFMLGRVMKKTRGKADPKKARELIGKILS